MPTATFRPAVVSISPNQIPSSTKKDLKKTKSPHLIHQLSLQKKIYQILKILGEDPEREGLKDTPKRYAQTMDFLTSGYQKDVSQLIGQALFKNSFSQKGNASQEKASNEIVIVKDIEFFSLCEHHLLPFFGSVHVAYLPHKKIIGLSKIPRIIDVYTRRLQIQENLTAQIAQEMQNILRPHGVAVVIEATHLCMRMRGVSKQSPQTVTYAMLGTFKNDTVRRKEVFHLLK